MNSSQGNLSLKDADIDELREQIGNNKRLSLILKIENPEAVKNFPHPLFRGIQEKNIEVMIARDDLATEIGFERLSEIQEEILWISEATHLPCDLGHASIGNFK